MRTTLLAAAVIAALVIPVVAYRAPAVPLATVELPRTELIPAETCICDSLGCPQDKNCDINRVKVTVVVGRKALRVESNWLGEVAPIERDGREWHELRSVLRTLDLDPTYRDLMLRIDDDVSYEDLLSALDFSRAAGFRPLVVHQPQG